MYKTADYEYQQLSFINFNASCGMQLDCENEWFKRASQLPWKAWEALYAALFLKGHHIRQSMDGEQYRNKIHAGIIIRNDRTESETVGLCKICYL